MLDINPERVRSCRSPCRTCGQELRAATDDGPAFKWQTTTGHLRAELSVSATYKPWTTLLGKRLAGPEVTLKPLVPAKAYVSAGDALVSDLFVL